MSRPKDLPIQEWERIEGKCNWEIKYGDPRTRCQEPATVEVFELSGAARWENGKVVNDPPKSQGKLCPKHAKEWDMFRLGVNAKIGAGFV